MYVHIYIYIYSLTYSVMMLLINLKSAHGLDRSSPSLRPFAAGGSGAPALGGVGFRCRV